MGGSWSSFSRAARCQPPDCSGRPFGLAPVAPALGPKWIIKCRPRARRRLIPHAHKRTCYGAAMQRVWRAYELPSAVQHDRRLNWTHQGEGGNMTPDYGQVGSRPAGASRRIVGPTARGARRCQWRHPGGAARHTCLCPELGTGAEGGRKCLSSGSPGPWHSAADPHHRGFRCQPRPRQIVRPVADAEPMRAICPEYHRSFLPTIKDQPRSAKGRNERDQR